MDFRRVNECLAARLAAQRRTQADLKQMSDAIKNLEVADDIPSFRKADAQFHLAVAVASRNPYVERAILDARDTIFFWHADRSYELILDTTLSGHQKIYEAIAARDSDAAATAMDEHLTVAFQEIKQVLGRPE